MERKIILACANNKDVFSQIEIIQAFKNFSESGKIIYSEIKEYYEADNETTSVDISIIEARVLRKYPRQDKLFNNIFSLFRDEGDVSAINILKEVISLTERNVGLKLSQALIENSPDISKYIEEYQGVSQRIYGALDNGSNEYSEISIESLFGKSEQDKKIKLLPLQLNSRIGGGIESGDNLLVFARPEIGKSLFTINASCGFLVQGYKVLYYGNEDAPPRIIRRLVQRLTGMSREEIINAPKGAEEIAYKRGYNNFTFCAGARNVFAEVRNYCDNIKPDVLILDQLRNINTKSDNRVLQLEEAAQEARHIAAEYKIPVISVTQAGDSAENKLNLSMGDIDYSNTGIPGAMDIMIGIGANEEYLNRSMRRISLPKNKSTGDHSSFDVVVNEQLSKILEN